MGSGLPPGSSKTSRERITCSNTSFASNRARLTVQLICRSPRCSPPTEARTFYFYSTTSFSVEAAVVSRGLRRIILFLENIGRGRGLIFGISHCRSIDRCVPRLAPFRRIHEPHAARRPHLDGARHSSRGAAATANKGTSSTNSDPQVRTEPSTRLAIIHQQPLTRADWMCVRAVA